MAIVTSKIRLAEALGNVWLPIEFTGLSKDSVVNVSQNFTVNKTFLVKQIGSVSEDWPAEVDEELQAVLYILGWKLIWEIH